MLDRRLLPFALVVSSLFLAAIVNLLIWTNVDSGLLYALPLVIGARFALPRLIVASAIGSVALDADDLYRGHASFQMWPLTIGALLLISWLAVEVATLRQDAERRATVAETARQQLQEFMGSVAHDLRSPVTVALGNLHLLRVHLDRGDSQAAREALDRIDRAVRNVNRLNGDLLDAVRIGANRFVIQRAPGDLAEITRQVVAEQQAENPDHSLILQAPAHVLGDWDALRLRQVITNLISNATKYSDSGTKVEVTLRQNPNSVVLQVKDHGSGLAQEQIAQLFQPFARLDRTQDPTGTGLGLFIAKGIIEAHGGRIWVDSVLGQGATFSVEIQL